MRSSFLVCAHLTICVCACVHSLEGTLMVIFFCRDGGGQVMAVGWRGCVGVRMTSIVVVVDLCFKLSAVFVSFRSRWRTLCQVAWFNLDKDQVWERSSEQQTYKRLCRWRSLCEGSRWNMVEAEGRENKELTKFKLFCLTFTECCLLLPMTCGWFCDQGQCSL